MKANVPTDVNWTAGFSGALAVSPSDASQKKPRNRGDLETAMLLGRRVAELRDIALLPVKVNRMDGCLESSGAKIGGEEAALCSIEPN